MEYRRLGRTGLQVSLVGLGTGGLSQLGLRVGATYADQYRLIHRALDLGVNLIDTAYSYKGCEALLGKLLQDVPRDSYLLATKAWPYAGEQGGEVTDPDDIERQCNESLERLGIDTIDIYQLHGVVPHLYRETVDRLYESLLRLRDSGKVRHIGITETIILDPTHEMLRMAVPEGLWDCVMLKYGIFNQSAAEDVLPHCVAQDVGVMNMAPVRARLTQPEKLQELLRDWVARGLVRSKDVMLESPLGWLLSADVNSVASAGYKFAAAHPAISSVLSGTSRVAHLEQNVVAILGAALPAEQLARLQAIFGHISEQTD